MKAHAYGNDFLYVREHDLRERDPSALAQAMCERHRGIGADGLILHAPTPDGAIMRLFNADGSRAEVSGNGVRGLGAILVRQAVLAARGATQDAHQGPPGGDLVIQTEGGVKRLTCLEAGERRSVFRAGMGLPSDVRQLDLETAAGPIRVVALWMGNPQCVVLDPGPMPLGAQEGEARLQELGPTLTAHRAFPQGTNVELATIDGPNRLRIWIWERGVGRTESSGTGTCAAAVAAARYGGAARDVEVSAPGGTQRVEWRDDDVYLTGWAQVTLDGNWLGWVPPPATAAD